MKAYLEAAVVVAACTLLCAAMFTRVDDANLVMVYLAGVALVSARRGRGPSAAAAVLGVACFDFFYVPPHFTFSVGDAQYVVTFAVMLAVALLISSLAVRARAHAEAAERAQLAVEEERLRSTLLSSVSHDFRTPLAAITGAVTCLIEQRESLDAPTRRDLEAAIREEAERLDRHVTNLLDITRLESGPVRLRRDWDSVEELIGGALARLDRLLAGRAVETSIAPDLPLVHVDAVLVEQVLVNLVENAAKYSSPQGRIRVEAARSDPGVQVSVSNDGPGIPAGDEERVFEKFYRAAAAPERGFGLGLPICRAILAAHGARIRAENVTGGVAFRFTLDARDGPAPMTEEDDRGTIMGQ